MFRPPCPIPINMDPFGPFARADTPLSCSGGFRAGGTNVSNDPGVPRAKPALPPSHRIPDVSRNKGSRIRDRDTISTAETLNPFVGDMAKGPLSILNSRACNPDSSDRVHKNSVDSCIEVRIVGKFSVLPSHQFGQGS